MLLISMVVFAVVVGFVLRRMHNHLQLVQKKIDMHDEVVDSLLGMSKLNIEWMKTMSDSNDDD